MKINKKVFTALAALVLSFLPVIIAPTVVFAKDRCVTVTIGSDQEEFCAEDPDPGTLPSRSVTALLPTITTVIAAAVGVVSVILIIYAGIMYATAAGDAGKVARAKQIIVGAIIGLIITIAAASIAAFVKSKMVP